MVRLAVQLQSERRREWSHFGWKPVGRRTRFCQRLFQLSKRLFNDRMKSLGLHTVAAALIVQAAGIFLHTVSSPTSGLHLLLTADAEHLMDAAPRIYAWVVACPSSAAELCAENALQGTGSQRSKSQRPNSQPHTDLNCWSCYNHEWQHKSSLQHSATCLCNSFCACTTANCATKWVAAAHGR
jgi:hypothetical protein